MFSMSLLHVCSFTDLLELLTSNEHCGFGMRPGTTWMKICVPASAEILSKPHQPKSPIFTNLDWNISNLPITSSVVFLSMPYSFGIFEYASTIENNKKSGLTCQKIGAVAGIISMKTHLKGAFGFGGFWNLAFLLSKKSDMIYKKSLDIPQFQYPSKHLKS